MLRKRIIAGNWKMYKTFEEAKNFAVEVKGEGTCFRQRTSCHLSTCFIPFRTR